MSPAWLMTTPSSTTIRADEPDALAKANAAFILLLDQPCLCGFSTTFHSDLGTSAACERHSIEEIEMTRRKTSAVRFRLTICLLILRIAWKVWARDPAPYYSISKLTYIRPPSSSI